mgnify:CR=1 FL=1
MRNFFSWALLLVVFVVGCGASDEPAASGRSLSALLPSTASMEDWHIAGEPVEYDSESLFEYLNGGAPLYLDFGFQRMTHARYQLGDDAFSSVTLDVYDMGSHLGAFGLYRSGRPQEVETRDWGAEGYLSGNVAAAWKGDVSIQAQADGNNPALIQAMEGLVSQVADGVDGDDSLPQIIALFPKENLVPWSERIIAKDLMSHAFLPGGVIASYRIEGNEGTLFFSELASEPEVTEAMLELRSHHEQWGEIVGDIDSIGDGGFHFSDPGLGSGAFVSIGSYVAGVHGVLPPAVQMDLLARLIGNLQSPPIE